MSSVDERVVEMQFKNSQFQSGVKSTLNSLDQLNRGMQLKGSTGGLSAISSGIEKLGGTVDSIAGRFKTLSVVAITALANIASRAVDAGLNFVKSFTVEPIAAGMESYNEQINATQVILANTAAQGTKLKDVTATLAELQQYANLTVYSFSDMTTNIGRFTAAGVPLKQATAAIKGMANVAALSGATTQQMSSAMYQMSQALATGVIRLQDWNSLSNANMAGSNVQKALEETARTMGDNGKKMDEAIKKNGSFRQSLQAGWLTSNIFNKAMKVMGGTIDQSTGKMRAFSVEELKGMGYSEKQAKSLHQLSQAALDSATKIRTIPQLLQALKEEVAGAYGNVFKTIFGNINQATKLFSNVHNVAEAALTTPINNLNRLLQGWAKLGGRSKAIDAIKQAFKDLGLVMTPIKDAFTTIFPPATAKDLYNITKAIDDFFHGLQAGSETTTNIERTFAGFFAIFDLGWQVIKQVARVIGDLFGVVSKGSGGVLSTTASIGDMIANFDDAVKHGKGLTNFFNELEAGAKTVGSALKVAAAFIVALFKGFDAKSTSKLNDALGNMAEKVQPLISVAKFAAKAWQGLINVFKAVARFFQPLAQELAHEFSGIWDAISSAFASGNYSQLLSVIDTGLLAGLVLIIKKFISGLGKNKDLSGGLLNTIQELFEGVTGTLKTMQSTLKATTLLEIAAAIGLLTLSLIGMASINSAQLTKSLGAIGVMFGQLLTAMGVIDKISTSKGFIKLPIVAAGLILLAGALDLMVVAVKEMAGLDWNGLTKGLTGISALIGGLVLATKGLSGENKGMLRTSASLILLAAAIDILASAVKKMSGISWGDMAKGLTGIAGILVSLALFTKFSEANKGGLTQGAGLLLLAEGINILAGAVQQMSGMSWGQMAKGLVGVAGGLAAMAAVLTVMPASSVFSGGALVLAAAALNIVAPVLQQFGQMDWSSIGKSMTELGGTLTLLAAAMVVMEAGLPGAAALIVAAGALDILAPALGQFGDMDWSSIGKSMTVLFGSLTLLAAGLTAMIVALPGAAALLVASGALAIFAPVLATLGNLSWGEILKGLVALAASLTLLGIAGIALIPAIPGLVGLATAIGLLGAGVALFGAGVAAFATGMATLAVSGAAGAAALVGIIQTVINTIPMVATALARGILDFASTLAAGSTQFVKAATTLLDAILTAIGNVSPKITSTMLNLLDNLVNAVAKHAPSMASAGLSIIMSLLRALDSKIGQISSIAANMIARFLGGIAGRMGSITAQGANILIAFINGISAQMGRVAQAGANAAINFVNSTANAIRNNSGAMGSAGANLGEAIVQGMASGLYAGVGSVISAAASVAANALASAKHVLGIHSPSKEFHKIGLYVTQGFSKGIRDGSKKDLQAAFKSLNTQITDAQKSATKNVAELKNKLQRQQNNGASKKAIKATRKSLREQERELAAYTRAHTLLKSSLNDEQKRIEKLQPAYDKLTTKIKKATDTLNAAKKTESDFAKTTKQQYNVLPDITSDTTLKGFKSDLTKQVNDTKLFAKELQRLRGMGLNNALYKELLSKGPDALPFMSQLIDGGKSAVKALNGQANALSSASGNLGTQASKALYQAAVNSAQGIVDGLKKQRKPIEKQMDAIANSMVNQIKKKLKIHSPSKVFEEIGQFTNKGLAQGLDKFSGVVDQAATGVGETAIVSMRNALSKVQDEVATQIDLNPAIKPVLDLSAVKKSATDISDAIGSPKVDVSAAYSKARTLDPTLVGTTGAATTVSNTTNISMVQNNNSPKALSAAEIYRQTNNQISTLKKGVGKNA